ncbi:hypothetical protein [Colwellia psychrerythraea]|uniref:Uncharacterized protein n=1 Tax=Colwellia psychrerythraea TaxID=28229 RepID=A0A099KR91_COLPS|nr:hypothetical protein [Colwellia psychrerythraea]KGJ92143.1 hypothetical protein ND2E_3036 [Colwellia psychrerythraea]
MTTSNQHNPQRTIEQIIDDEIASEAASTPMTKSTAQLHAEFEQRKQARHTDEQALLASESIFSSEDCFEESNIRMMSFQLKSGLVSQVKTSFACSLIRNALQRQLQTPIQLSLALCNHPCFCLLFDSPQRQKLLANQAPLDWQTFEQPTELHQLSHQLTVALPELASDFETQTGLGEVWQEAVLVLLRSPLPYPLLDNLHATDVAALVLASYQTSLAKQVSPPLAVDKKQSFLGRLQGRIYSWCVLRGVVNKAKKLKQA